jgi:hypothetical protein
MDIPVDPEMTSEAIIAGAVSHHLLYCAQSSCCSSQVHPGMSFFDIHTFEDYTSSSSFWSACLSYYRLGLSCIYLDETDHDNHGLYRDA